jgi:diguanylate cyclase (GGDEF)-like protein
MRTKRNGFNPGVSRAGFDQLTMEALMEPITEAEAIVPPCKDEAERLATLRGYYALETGYERRFDDITLLASRFCATPVALVGLVDETRVFFKSALGFTVSETPRSHAFFDYAMRRGKVFEVRDASRDPRFEQHPWVAGAPHIRFYAGAPIVAPNGHVVGSVSVIDYVRRKLTSEQCEALQLLAAQVRAQLELGVLAPRDPLTGLYNRRHLTDALERELSRAVRRRSRLGVIALDIDNFKRINDAYGHDAGDAALQEFGALLAGSIRKEDIACRLGSEEFLLVMPDAATDVVAARAEKLRARVEALELRPNPDVAYRMTVSIGVAAYPEHGSTPEKLLLEAEHAVYLAKDSGRNRVVIAPRGLDYRETLDNGVAPVPQVMRCATTGLCA